MKPPLTQIDLVGAIGRLLDKEFGIKLATIRVINAIITAADGICDAINTPDKPSVPGSGLDAWLASDDTGLSSKYMAYKLAGRPHCEYAHPLDQHDFGRCVRLLEAVPELRVKLGEMAACSPLWGALVDDWAPLEILYRGDKLTYEKFKEFVKE